MVGIRIIVRTAENLSISMNRTDHIVSCQKRHDPVSIFYGQYSANNSSLHMHV